MAEMTSQLLNAKGFQVETRSGFDTNALRQAQEAGHIDLYWEYTGTSLREFNKVTERLTPAETYNRVKQLDAQKGLVWLEPSRVNNTYALAMRRADATAKGISTISDLAAKVLQGERLAFASTSEFFERSDGLRPLEQAYGFEFARDRVVRVDIDLIYQMLRNLAFIDVGLVFATDGRIPAYDLLVLKDDRKFFPDYSMAPVVRREKPSAAPGACGSPGKARSGSRQRNDGAAEPDGRCGESTDTGCCLGVSQEQWPDLAQSFRPSSWCVRMARWAGQFFAKATVET